MSVLVQAKCKRALQTFTFFDSMIPRLVIYLN